MKGIGTIITVAFLAIPLAASAEQAKPADPYQQYQQALRGNGQQTNGKRAAKPVNKQYRPKAQKTASAPKAKGRNCRNVNATCYSNQGVAGMGSSAYPCLQLRCD